MGTEIARAYDEFYRARDPVHVYPVEFVVRAYLGRYPRLAGPKPRYQGTRVVDLGFGDGRNMPLLANLGMHVSGVEIAADICERVIGRMNGLGIQVDARVGRNHAVPFDTAYFDHVLACHSCYYVEPGTTFADNVREIARVLKPAGSFVFSAPMATSYIMRGARDLGDGHMAIANDPYGVRNGHVLKKFDNETELIAALTPWFADVAVGACRNDFWGIEEHVWIGVCRRSERVP